MTVEVFDTAAVESARERGGEAREDRPEEAETALEVEDTRVGFQCGVELLERDYAEYPTGEDTLRPEAGDVLEALADHDMVGSVEDIGDELRAEPSTVEKALELHGVEPPTEGQSEGVEEREGEIMVPLVGVVPTDHLRTPVFEDARLLEHLYIRCGYGIDEIQEYISTQMNLGRGPEKSRWTVRRSQIRDALEAVGLLEEVETESNPYAEDDIRLGKTGLRHEDKRDRSTDTSTVHVDDYE